MTRHVSPERCDETVAEPGTWPRFHQCVRKRLPGTTKCKQHGAEAVAARRAKGDAKYEASCLKHRYEWNGKKFYDALETIARGHNDARTVAAEALDASGIKWRKGQ